MSCFLGFCEGDTRNRWRDGQVCPDVDKELRRLGPDGSGVFWRVIRIVNTPLVVKKGSFSGDRRRPGKERSEEEDKRVRERERTEGEGGKRVGDGKRESGRERERSPP
ncbi:hypothetical protein TNCV_3613481 [Trichonephila clavipes]|uniref:Uncharacterized protein n=1 Tax=Trichonephila clavipes TaxID=2585209 RepID=A0A8X6SI63_TRICX|nr:hypothetical protein TNCV_3613481 [Trichonephila clavipes]